MPAAGRVQSVVGEAGVPRCLLGVFHSDGAGNVHGRGAQYRLVSSPPPVRILCCREGKGRALLSAEGYHALTAGRRAAFKGCWTFRDYAVHTEARPNTAENNVPPHAIV